MAFQAPDAIDGQQDRIVNPEVSRPFQTLDFEESMRVSNLTFLSSLRMIEMLWSS
jgi:hypothetical protein